MVGLVWLVCVGCVLGVVFVGVVVMRVILGGSLWVVCVFLCVGVVCSCLVCIL